ncbi:MAG: RNA 2',3'-cyclic phosphodiesterase [Methanospirillum sp.]|nr:RNA 2',3'-cyclic phosphodiesterase [Methanospirillum sp.]
MVRLFVAVDLPEEIREQFRDVQEELRRSRARLTLVGTESMHITLKFIGEVSGSQVPQITAALSQVKDDIFSLNVGIITANNQRAPRVVWAETDDPGDCRRLAGNIDNTLASLGFEPEKRRFHPHITLARVKQFHPSLFEALAGVATSCSGIIPVSAFVLKKSELTPEGPRYTDILSVPLGERT